MNKLSLYGWIYIIIVNIVAWLMMSADKRRAQQHAWRIPEARMFGVAAIGGTLGIWIGMRMFRHKTKHGSFRIGIPLLLVVQLVLLSMWIR